jgi:hypothetical protein
LILLLTIRALLPLHTITHHKWRRAGALAQLLLVCSRQAKITAAALGIIVRRLDLAAKLSKDGLEEWVPYSCKALHGSLFPSDSYMQYPRHAIVALVSAVGLVGGADPWDG